MAALEYEVRDEYRDYSLEQLLEAPVTCFQGVGDIQSEILERYFHVTTVKDLAELAPFLEALQVQETVLGGGDTLGKPVGEASTGRDLGFHVRTSDQTMRVADLPDAPVHVLEGLTPGQDLALYDAFRITNVAHLAQNRIMLEARVIAYLAGQGGRGAGGEDAVASILGARAASAASGQARARTDQYEGSRRMQSMATEVTEHVRDRVAAMRDRAHDRAGEGPVGRGGPGTASAMNRLSSIRETRERGQMGRDTAPERGRSAGMSRTEEIMASRATGGGGARVSARGVADSRSDFGAGRTSVGSSRAESVMAARQGAGRGAPHQAASGGATVRARPSSGAGGGTATATATRPGTQAAAAGAGAAAGAAAGTAGAELRTEEQAAAAGGTQTPAARRRRQPPPSRAPFIAAAVIVLLLLAGLIWFLVSRSGERGMPTTAGTTPSEQTGMTGTGAPGSEGAAGTQGTAGMAGQPGATGTGTGTQGMAGTGTEGAAGTGTQGAAGTGTGTQGAMGTTTAGPAGIKTTHTVVRGDTLWFISDREYADPLNWPSIFMENKDRIDNPDLIYPGQKFRIPASPEYRFPAYPEGYSRSR